MRRRRPPISQSLQQATSLSAQVATPIDNDTRLATLDTRMTSLEEMVRQLITDIRSRGHIPWTPLLSALGFFAGALLWVVTTQTGPIAKDLDQRAATLTNEIGQRTGTLGRDLDRTAATLDKLDMRAARADEVINTRIDKLGRHHRQQIRGARGPEQPLRRAEHPLRDRRRPARRLAKDHGRSHRQGGQGRREGAGRDHAARRARAALGRHRAALLRPAAPARRNARA